MKNQHGKKQTANLIITNTKDTVVHNHDRRDAHEILAKQCSMINTRWSAIGSFKFSPQFEFPAYLSMQKIKQTNGLFNARGLVFLFLFFSISTWAIW